MTESEHTPSPQIVIVVEDGCVQNVMANTAVRVMLKDFDNIKAGALLDPHAFDFPVGVFTDAELYDEIIIDVDEESLDLPDPVKDFVPGLYQHFKKGDYYLAVGVATDAQDEHLRVVYQSLQDAKMYSRTLANWREMVASMVRTSEKVPRFEHVRPIGGNIHEQFHSRWTAAVGTPGYNKADWRALEARLKQAGLI